jgi:molybdopterin molybdotransferase
MISLEAARALIAQSILPLPIVRLPLAAALGHVLREETLTSEDLPAFDRSAMDGYAVNAEDRSERFRVVAEIQPGSSGTVSLGVGECARIFTGAAIPAGATQVIMQEDAKREGDLMSPTRRTAATNIRWRGEDARAGSVLLRAGTRLGAAELALLAQLGVTEPGVSPAVRALHFTTGNELVDPATQPGPGQMRDTNSILIAALLADRGAEVVARQRFGDSLDALAGAIEANAASSWDLLLISGGASVGDYDFGARALERVGFAIHFRQLDLRPGKPLIFATRGAQAAFVIPGNPVSHFVTFHTAIARAIECLEAAPESWLLAKVPLASALPEKPNARETWWPARVALEVGNFTATPLAWQSSGDLCGLASANALIGIPSHSNPFGAGASVDCLLLGWPA